MKLLESLKARFSREPETKTVPVISTPSYKLGKETEKLLFGATMRGAAYAEAKAQDLRAKVDELVAQGKFNFDHFNRGFKLQDGTDYREGGMDILFLKEKGVIPESTRAQGMKLAL